MIRIVSTEGTATMLRNAGQLAVTVHTVICLLWCALTGTANYWEVN
jgi:hypothetical protein